MKKLQTVLILICAALVFLTLDSSSQTTKNNISLLLNEAKKINHLDSINFAIRDSIKNVFQEIEKRGISTQADGEHIYELIHWIYDRSLIDEEYIRLLFEIDSIVKRNAEIGQFLSELNYKIAISNTDGFIRVFSTLPSEIKQRVKNNLLWLFEFEKQDIFVLKLDSIQKDHKKVVVELKQFISNH